MIRVIRTARYIVEREKALDCVSFQNTGRPWRLMIRAGTGADTFLSVHWLAWGDIESRGLPWREACMELSHRCAAYFARDMLGSWTE